MTTLQVSLLSVITALVITLILVILMATVSAQYAQVCDSMLLPTSVHKGPDEGLLDQTVV